MNESSEDETLPALTYILFCLIFFVGRNESSKDKTLPALCI